MLSARGIAPRFLAENIRQVGDWMEAPVVAESGDRGGAVLSNLYPLIPRGDVRRWPAVVPGVADELHQLGGLMVGDMLEADGWEVRYLGSNLPVRDVVRAVTEHRARIVGGRLFRSLPDLWREIGADGCGTDPRDAARLARELTAGSGTASI